MIPISEREGKLRAKRSACMRMVEGKKERKSEDEVLRRKNVKHLVPRCETQGEAGLHTLLLRFKSILACLSNGERAPEELICTGTLIFLRRRTSVPLLVPEEGCLSIPRAMVSI